MTEIFGRLPVPTPETMHFWDGAREHKLLLQRCEACEKAYFPPRPHCPQCGSRRVAVFEASGRASLYSYTIDHINLRDGGPVAVAVAELEEGVRMMCNLLEVEQTPEALQLDMPLQVVFQKINDEITLPQFKPAGDA